MSEGHILAEKIRQHTKEAYGRILKSYGPAYAAAWKHGRDCAANSIDPEAKGCV